MKKTLLTLSLVALFSSPAFASKQGAYIGADIGANYVGSYYLDSNIGLVAGYDFQLSPKVVVGIEGEYRNLGSDSAFDGTSGINVGADVSASSYGINIKPKYYFTDSFYGAVMVGMHRITYEEKLTIGNDTLGGKDTANGFASGIEGGYEFDNNISIRGGIKYARADLLGYDTEFGTFYAGVNYKFN
ncbi:porin family protein [Photobacterium sp. BZF1]|uniref:outer membrane beta-barrel protein n=1 Tax=Photobacterium sp. BZF1 TaxID=1904457 RepID=UPI0016538681|nr:outer membrane beta-barrel protein [Photobacterium sp. BZF1]MBC7003053.1 porin family protein [Photobacterium sp. BZF1]